MKKEAINRCNVAWDSPSVLDTLYMTYTLSDTQHERFERLYADYRRLANDPEHCRPMIVVNVPAARPLPTWGERIADPRVMMRAELDQLWPHLELGDDRPPAVRIMFGTGLIAAAFGCEIVTPPNNIPCAGAHVLQSADDVFRLPTPSLHAGWLAKLWDWMDIYLAELPAGIHIQHPDIQSPFNNANLIRGNDILLDMYDRPDAVQHLLTKITDYMITLTRHAKAKISSDPEWFFDWGMMWKGFVRISNCSLTMISPEFYRSQVFAHDRRFLAEVGGGRIHYCGTQSELIHDFCQIPLMSGLDVDCHLNDFFTLCEQVPASVVLASTHGFDVGSRELERLLAGDWPRKRNIIVTANARSMEEGRELLVKLRESARVGI